MRIGDQATVRRFAVLLAVVLLVSGCGNGNPAGFRDTPTGISGSASSPIDAPASSTAAATPEPAGSRTPAVMPTQRAAPAGLPRAPLSLSLTEPLPPMQGRQITAIYQDGCGDPSRALVYVEVADPANISSVWYEYHVGTPVPFDGVNRSPSTANDFRVWRGMIGPFEANPRNADGGPIVVTAHGIYRDGSERIVTATWTLNPCHR